MATITDEDLFEVSTLVYRRWADEYDLLKKVKVERDDGQPDWAEMHVVRLKNHTEREAKWKALLTRITAQLPKLN